MSGSVVFDTIERLAIMFRRKTGRKLPDSIIAATAITVEISFSRIGPGECRRNQ
jgi:hypothetical protein